jgi:hypothetical protein
MSKYSTLVYRLYHWVAMIPGKISWSKKTYITLSDKTELAGLLADGYYIILTGNKSHLSSVVVSFLTWIKTGVWANYTHALMNCDNITDPSDSKSFKFVEATATGVHYSTFEQVFECDTVCLLTPNNIDNAEWTRIIDALLQQQGKPYDDLFDLSDDTHVSCVELVLNALKAVNYEEKFADLNKLIEKEKNLVPQMFRNCTDFTVKCEKFGDDQFDNFLE